MTVKTLIKQIASVYNARLEQTKENTSVKDVSLANFAYQFFSSQYGVKKIAD